MKVLNTFTLRCAMALLGLTFCSVGFRPAPADGFATMILVKGGEYKMGDAEMVGDADEQPLRKVKINGFYLSRYELTYEEYDEYCAKTWAQKPEDYGWGRARRPVVNVSWYDALLYCNWRSKNEGLKPCYTIDKLTKDPNNENLQDLDRWTVVFDAKANGYRLPTEAEWEYAARGGLYTHNYVGAGGNGVDTIGWYVKNAVRQTFPVGLKSPNELGLYDMSGNVWEMCWDWHADNYKDLTENNPCGAKKGAKRVVRGGSWEDAAYELRISNRNGVPPFDKNTRSVGLRLARNIE